MFNAGGSKYRLAARVNYRSGRVFILAIIIEDFENRHYRLPSVPAHLAFRH